jgi:hypothetical protein
MAAFFASNDMRCRVKALKMGAEGTWANLFAIDSWEKELTAQSCTLFPGDILLRNSDEVPPNRNRSGGLESVSREDDRAMLEVNIFMDKPGYLA